MVGHIYKLEYSLYPNFTIMDFQSTVRAIDSFCLYWSRQFCLYWSRTLFLAIFLLAAMRRQNRIKKFQEPTLTYLYPYYCTKNLICDRHVTSILAPRYVLHVHVFTKILSVSGKTPRGRYRLMK